MSRKRITQDIGDVISEAGFERLKKGQVLTFDYEGSLTTFKIQKMYTDKDGQHVIVKETTLYTPDQVKIVEKK